MLLVRKKRSAVVTISMLSVLLLVLLQNVNISFANDDNRNLTVENLNFQMLESSEDKGIINNINSINIGLPSSDWNIKDIELNFTDIEYVREIVTIEDNPNKNDKYLRKNQLDGLGVLIKLYENVTIYGVYIYINEVNAEDNDRVYVQIRGYDSSTNVPNTSIYRSVELNSSIGAGWYYQNFSSPLTLIKGNYTLVMIAEFFQSANTYYYWYYTNPNPNNPDLYSSDYDGVIWKNVIQGSPFLYKLDQKIIADFYPKESNMTAEIGGIANAVSNCNKAGSGTIKLTDINYSPNNKVMNIPIINNKSNQLIFNLSYYLKLKNQFYSYGLVKIDVKEDNIWIVNPNIVRYNYNYSIQFKYPEDWYDLNVSKNGEDITLTKDILIDGAWLYILNDTITGYNSWEISAKSPKTDFSLDVRKTEFTPGQELIFSAIAPTLEGNFTFILIDAFGYEKDKKIIPVTSEEILYSYLIPTSPYYGNWTAYIFWNSFSDAGVISQNFTILDTPISSSSGGGGGGGGGSTETTVIEPISGIVITLGIIVGSAGSLTAYQTVKKVKKKRDLHTQALYNKFKDNLSLNYLMISDHKSGLNVYEQFFAGKSIDPSLLSGFLEAIRNFGIELTGSYKTSETVKLEYQNSKILMNDRKDFRLILIMSADPSEEFKNSITNLADEIEEKYGHLLHKFKGGEITMFSGIKELIEKHLNVAFTYPLRIVDTTGMKLTRAEKLMIQRAKSVMKQTNLSHFYTSFLMPDQQYDPEKTKTIFNLIDKGIFRPISLNFKK